MVNQKAEESTHEIHMYNRAKGDVTGVVDVISFDLDEIVLETTAGLLKIKGNKLHVKTVNLEKKVMEFEGNVSDINYAASKVMKRKSAIGRLFG